MPPYPGRVTTLRPMLATKGDHVPAGDGWSHEIKWDGMRVLVEVSGSGARLYSRNGADVSPSYPELAGIASVVPDCLLDGEVVAFAEGRPSFGALQQRMHVSRADLALRLAEQLPVTLMTFDVLALPGRDVTGEPLGRRRARLAGLDINDDRWQTPPSYDDGQLLLAATREQGLEGIVSKARDSVYLPGQRSRRWLKFAHRGTASYVVGGWRPEVGSASRLGAVLVGEPGPDGLRYRGRVGSGLAGRAGERLQVLLGPLARRDCPFADEVPRLDALGTHWVEPVLVIEVAAQGLSTAERLRQPSYQGLRSDLSPEDLS